MIRCHYPDNISRYTLHGNTRCKWVIHTAYFTLDNLSFPLQNLQSDINLYQKIPHVDRFPLQLQLNHQHTSGMVSWTEPASVGWYRYSGCWEYTTGLEGIGDWTRDINHRSTIYRILLNLKEGKPLFYLPGRHSIDTGLGHTGEGVREKQSRLLRKVQPSAILIQ